MLFHSIKANAEGAPPSVLEGGLFDIFPHSLWVNVREICESEEKYAIFARDP